ncbi:MAG: transposase, partial [Trichodesmium sp. St4_bin8_1]|nr:transposase [Trichodesmium sp. St4_bin8_1]
SFSKKTNNSKKDKKARLKIAKLHRKLKDTKRDFPHKLSSKIIRENQTTVLEDLHISRIVKNQKLSTAIYEKQPQKNPDIFKRKSKKIHSGAKSN